jgi:hypothetical protein
LKKWIFALTPCVFDWFLVATKTRRHEVRRQESGVRSQKSEVNYLPRTNTEKIEPQITQINTDFVSAPSKFPNKIF